MIKLSEYIVSLIEEQKTQVRREIRLAKIELKQLDKFIKAFRSMSDNEIMDALSDNEEMLAQYNDLRTKVSELEDSELKKLVRTGKIREVFYDKDGAELKLSDDDFDKLQSEIDNPQKANEELIKFFKEED